MAARMCKVASGGRNRKSTPRITITHSISVTTIGKTPPDQMLWAKTMASPPARVMLAKITMAGRSARSAGIVDTAVCRSAKSQKLVISVKRPSNLPRYTVSGLMAKRFYSRSKPERCFPEAAASHNLAFSGGGQGEDDSPQNLGIRLRLQRQGSEIWPK